MPHATLFVRVHNVQCDSVARLARWIIFDFIPESCLASRYFSSPVTSRKSTQISLCLRQDFPQHGSGSLLNLFRRNYVYDVYTQLSPANLPRQVEVL